MTSSDSPKPAHPRQAPCRCVEPASQQVGPGCAPPCPEAMGFVPHTHTEPAGKTKTRHTRTRAHTRAHTASRENKEVALGHPTSLHFTRRNASWASVSIHTQAFMAQPRPRPRGPGVSSEAGTLRKVRCPWGWCPWVAPTPSISPTSGGQASSSRKAPSCNLRAEVNRGQPERRRLGVLGASTGTRERRRLGFGAESKSTGFGAESGSGMRCSFGKS